MDFTSAVPNGPRKFLREKLVEGCRIHGGLSHPLLDMFSMSVIVPAKAGLFGKVFCNLRQRFRKIEIC